MICLECEEEATWVRDTQFAGKHPYCEKHAMEQPDFGESESGFPLFYKIRVSHA